MDQPTLAVAEYLEQKFKFLRGGYDELIKEKLRTLNLYNEELFKVYHPETQGGWHVTIAPLSPEEEKEIRVMSFLLLDKDNYSS